MGRGYVSTRLLKSTQGDLVRLVRRLKFKLNFGQYVKVPVLELGPGFGYGLEAMQAMGVASGYVGVDVDAEVLGFLRQRFPGFVFLDQLPRTESPALLGPFSTIFLQHVLEHVPRDEVIGFLSELRRLASSGGVLICEVPNAGHPILGAFARFDDFTHRVGYTSNSLEQVVLSAGWEVVHCGGVRNFGLHPALWLVGLRLLPGLVLSAILAFVYRRPVGAFLPASIFVIAKK